MKKRAFTLIEMMISVALFSIVIVIVGAAYLNLLNLDRQTRATDDVANNLNFVVDSMGRSLRTGTGYYCGSSGGPNCETAPQSTLSFTNDQGQPVTYSLSSGRIMECYGSGCTATPITDSRITISKLSFFVTGVNSGPIVEWAVEPRVTVIINGSITIDPTHAPVTFDVETSATQRQIDI